MWVTCKKTSFQYFLNTFLTTVVPLMSVPSLKMGFDYCVLNYKANLQIQCNETPQSVNFKSAALIRVTTGAGLHRGPAAAPGAAPQAPWLVTRWTVPWDYSFPPPSSVPPPRSPSCATLEGRSAYVWPKSVLLASNPSPFCLDEHEINQWPPL